VILLADLLIPANDDSIPSIQLLLTDFVQAIQKENKILSKKLSVKNIFKNLTLKFVLIYQFCFDPLQIKLQL
jgi:ribosomal protein S2